MTAWGSVEKAVEAMRRGARDFVEKPWDNARLLATLRTQVELGRALRQSRRLEGENQLLRADGAPELIAESPAMRPVLQLMERVAPSDANVLITGEHGTGKEVVARWLHAASPRAGKPLVAVNLGGLSEGVFESELFGHVKGAFTDARTDRIGRFELADGGHPAPRRDRQHQPAQQAKLLRVLETGELERVGSSRTRRVDVRIALGHQRRPARRGRGGALPRGPALPAQHGRDPPPAAARAARGHRRRSPQHFLAATPRATGSRSRVSSAEAVDGARVTRLARQRPRARPHARARGAAGAGHDAVRAADLGLRRGRAAPRRGWRSCRSRRSSAS